jgi:hypothetical protein
VPFKETWRPLTLILLVAIAAGVINVLFYLFVMKQFTDGLDDVSPGQRSRQGWRSLACPLCPGTCREPLGVVFEAWMRCKV